MEQIALKCDLKENLVDFMLEYLYISKILFKIDQKGTICSAIAKKTI